MIAVYYRLVLKHVFNCWYSRLLLCSRYALGATLLTVCLQHHLDKDKLPLFSDYAAPVQFENILVIPAAVVILSGICTD